MENLIIACFAKGREDRPVGGNAVKLRICASKHDLVCDYRLLRFLKLLRLLRFFECADRR